MLHFECARADYQPGSFYKRELPSIRELVRWSISRWAVKTVIIDGFVDLGGGSLSKCEVEWAISQVRLLRGTYFLPNLPKYSVVAPGLYHDKAPNNAWQTEDRVYPDCVHYGHRDHGAVHRAVFQTDFGTGGPQIGRTCSAAPDVPDSTARKNATVDDYQLIFGVVGFLEPIRTPQGMSRRADRPTRRASGTCGTSPAMSNPRRLLTGGCFVPR